MSVTAAKGFKAAGVAARISKLGPDLAVVAGDGACVGAAMFTTNRVQAAPVVVSKEHLDRAEPRAVVINSGNANAATGEGGIVAARATAERTAHLLGLRAEEVLVLSTGVIGVPLPVERVLGGVERGRRRALAGRRRRRGQGDPHHRHVHEGSGRARRRIQRRRHGEGLGDDPSEPCDDARRRHDRLPARAG